MECFNVVILVVLYGKEIEDSLTLNSLANFNLPQVKLIIHNNGPKKLALESGVDVWGGGYKSISIYNDLGNSPLSHVYNKYIKEYVDADRFVVFDDDTQVDYKYIDSLMNGRSDIEVPIIIDSNTNHPRYPFINDMVSNQIGVYDTSKDKCMSIASGLVISKRLINVFFRSFDSVFDENYSLYGVDSSFFKRLIILSKRGEFFSISVSGELQHNLSSSDSGFNEFRFEERLWDTAISTRRYPSFFQTYYFMKTLLRLFGFFKFRYFSILIKGFILGSHPKVISSRRKW